MNRFLKKTAVWETIARSLSEDIVSGHYQPGDKLPTEAELSKRFEVNRHTIRSALRDMAESGLIYARRGSGVFVAQTPADYPLGRRVRFHNNLEKAGRVPGKETISIETRPADQAEADALGLTKGDPVHSYEALSLADNEPIVFFRSVFPAERFPDLLEHITYSNSVTAALRACGVADYTRAKTRISARRATASQAQHLRIHQGDPILLSVAVNVDPDGIPTEYGVSWFAGDRVTLSLDGEDG